MESSKSVHNHCQNPMKEASSRSPRTEAEPQISKENKVEERALSKKGTRRFLGVRQRPSGRWVAEIKDSSQKLRLWLGTFDAPKDAALAYDKAATLLRGTNAKTNFPTTHGKSFTVLSKNPRLNELLKSQNAATKSKEKWRNYRRGREEVEVMVEDTIVCGPSNGISEHNGVSNTSDKLLISRLVGSSKVYSSVFVVPSFSASH